jgi:sigma-B regulation protein RsbU (phosphoserine phosphatase)
MFVSLFLAVLDIPTGKLTYVNAGHNPPLLRRMDGTLQKVDRPHGPVLGGAEDSRYEDGSVVLGGGDTLLLYTDGLTEAMNARGELFAEQRLARLVSEPHPSPQNLTRSVLQAVHTFQNGTPPSDDITLLALEYRRYPLAYDI